ncbi:MAG: hypothetical protein H6828_13990 [Planctomycetes bacterium]|nr:hypothetical protein [Planctomycetota bacterium]
MGILTSPSAPARPAGDPNVAALLTWFVPGAGHVYLGRTTFAILAFLVVEGIYILGLKLSGGMGFQFLQEELRGALAPALAPEAGNLGGLLYQMKVFNYGGPNPTAFPATVHLGVMLTAASGVLNALLMSQAHFDARLPRGVRSMPGSPAFAALLTWLLPGAGHLYQGRKLRGALVFVTIVGLVALGTVLAEGSNLSRERHYYYWGGQFLAGLPGLVMELVHGHAPLAKHVVYGEAGLVLASVGGLLNILAMLDVYRWGELVWPGWVAQKEAERESAAAAQEAVA